MPGESFPSAVHNKKPQHHEEEGDNLDDLYTNPSLQTTPSQQHIESLIPFRLQLAVFNIMESNIS